MVSITNHSKYHSAYFCYLGAFDLNIGLLSIFLDFPSSNPCVGKTAKSLNKSFNYEILL